MRIEDIIIKNYRQYRDEEIILKKSKECDLFIIIGRNGTGKTNLLNAINWCLYYDEVHLSRESKGLPILNLNTINDSKAGDKKEVMVKIGVSADDDRYYSFERKEQYLLDNKKMPSKRQTSFIVTNTDVKGNAKFIEGEEAENYVERFFPRGIREYFFFDGERLDNYFKEAKAQNISHAVFEISQIDLLERISKNFDTLSREYTREIGKTNPQINDTELQLERAKSNLEDIDRRIKEKRDNLNIAISEIQECTKALADIPDVRQLEKEREELREASELKEGLLEESTSEKNELILEYGKIVYLLPAINNTVKIIDDQHKSGEIPPSIDKDLLKEMVNINTCKICNRKLDEESKQHVVKLIEKHTLSGETANKLILMEGPIKNYLNKMNNLEKELSRKDREIQQYENELTSNDKRLKAIDKQMGAYDAEKIKSWYKKRDDYERIKSEAEVTLGRFKSDKEKQKIEIDKLNDQLREDMDKEYKAKNIKLRIALCDKANRIVTNAKESIMQETRRDIEKETKEIFFNLLWKKETYADVRINVDYSISLIHSMGFDALGTTSAAERELLALAFTLALHKASGFDCPILIDTPLARVADEHRENFAKIFSAISKEKQTILLFTSAEYSYETSNILDSLYSNKYTLNLSKNEKETKIGE